MTGNFYKETRRPGGTKKISWLSGFLIFLFLFATARAADSEAQFNKWFEVQTNLQSWSADFTQTRTLTVLNQPLVSHGKVWVKRGEFRWELGQPGGLPDASQPASNSAISPPGQPPQTLVVRTPEQLEIIYPRLKRAEIYPLDAVPSGPMRDALALLDASLPRDRAAMEKNFQLLSATETNAVLQMTLQPRREAARKFIGQVVIAFHTNDFIIASTEMKFADGSKLHNEFANVVLNPPLAPELFETNVPPDYSVVEPLKR